MANLLSIHEGVAHNPRHAFEVARLWVARCLDHTAETCLTGEGSSLVKAAIAALNARQGPSHVTSRLVHTIAKCLDFGMENYEPAMGAISFLDGDVRIYAETIAAACVAAVVDASEARTPGSWQSAAQAEAIWQRTQLQTLEAAHG